MSISNANLGVWNQNCPSGNSPAQDQPAMNQNNNTLQNTYSFNHQPLGSSQYAGFHGIISLFPPAEVPTAGNYWQIYADPVTFLPMVMPPTSAPNGSQPQLLCNTSTLSKTYGTTWTYAVASPVGTTVQVTVLCPFGGNLIFVTITVTYTQATSSIGLTNVPLQNPYTNTKVPFGAPIFGGGTTNSLSQTSSWFLNNFVDPLNSTAPNAFTNSIYINTYCNNSAIVYPISFGAFFIYSG